MKEIRQLPYLILNVIRNIVLNFIFFILSVLILRSKKIWIIGGGSGIRFADNSKHLFIYLNKFSNKRIIWITRREHIKEKVRNLGYESYLTNEFKGILYSLKAKVHIVDVSHYDINSFTSFGAIKVNLWHGIPLKKIGIFKNISLKEISNIRKKLFFIVNKQKCIKKIYDYTIPGLWIGKYIYFLTTSNFTKYLPAAFDVPKNHIILANYPRNEILIQGEKLLDVNDDEINLNIKKIMKFKKSGKNIIGYFPTYRDDGTNQYLDIKNSEEMNILSIFLQENNFIIVSKNHPGVKSKNVQNMKPFYQNNPNIINLGKFSDLNPILNYCDILITDYSGVYFDFLWLNRPIIFYPYDFEMYSKKVGFFFDYNSFTPGRKVYNIQNLIKSLKDYCFNKNEFQSEYENERKNMLSIIFEKQKGSSIIEKVIEKIIEK